MTIIKDISRRKFLGQVSCATVGYSTLYSTLNSLKFMNAASMANSTVFGGDDYKALVCVLLGGGCDSWNMLIPNSEDAYETYATTRSNIAIPREDLLALNNTNLAVHPSMTSAQTLFNENKLSFVTNVGTLVEPIDKQEFYNQTVPVPLGLYSHSDQMQQWQTGITTDRGSIGWGGKLADMMGDMNTAENVSMNISMNNGNIFQRGAESIEYVLNPTNVSGIRGYGQEGLYNQLLSQSIDNIIDAAHQDVFKKTYVDVMKISRDAFIDFTEAVNPIPDFETTNFYTENDNYSRMRFHAGLELIAKTVAARNSLGMKRQIFFIEYSGWDHHDVLLQDQYQMLDDLTSGLLEFNKALEEINMSDCVTTFTVSEFGRTLTSNGNGTDHAWGGNAMVMGGSVQGGQIFGTYPSLELFGNIELGGGVLIPGISTDEYMAELAMWFGVAPSELITLFPTLNNFYSSGSEPPIGFLDV